MSGGGSASSGVDAVMAHIETGCSVCGSACGIFYPTNRRSLVCECGHLRREHAPCPRKQYQFGPSDRDSSNRCLSCGLDVVAHVKAEHAPCPRKQYQFGPSDRDSSNRCLSCGLDVVAHVEAEDVPCALTPEYFANIPSHPIHSTGRCSACGLDVGRHHREEPPAQRRRVDEDHDILVQMRDEFAKLTIVRVTFSAHSGIKAFVMHLQLNSRLTLPDLPAVPRFVHASAAAVNAGRELEDFQPAVRRQLQFVVESLTCPLSVLNAPAVASRIAHEWFAPQVFEITGTLGDIVVGETAGLPDVRLICEVKTREKYDAPSSRGQFMLEMVAYMVLTQKPCWGAFTDSTRWIIACSTEVFGHFAYREFGEPEPALRTLHLILSNRIVPTMPVSEVLLPGRLPQGGGLGGGRGGGDGGDCAGGGGGGTAVGVPSGAPVGGGVSSSEDELYAEIDALCPDNRQEKVGAGIVEVGRDFVLQFKDSFRRGANGMLLLDMQASEKKELGDWHGGVDVLCP